MSEAVIATCRMPIGHAHEASLVDCQRDDLAVLALKTPPHSINGVAFDHLAHAVPRWHDVWTRYAVHLGAEWNFGDYGPGFAPAQLRFANGARIEVLMPHDSQRHDFLTRFIASNGPGPHHMTFKVPDLSIAVECARVAGFQPIGINRDDPKWMEAFLHPRSASGVLVQLAQVWAPLVSAAPDDYPNDRRQRLDGSGMVPPASFLQVVHAVANLESGVHLFAGLLGGTIESAGTRSDHRWVNLTWGGPLGLRLIAPLTDASSSPLHEWLRGRSGRVHHLDLEVEEPSSIPGAIPCSPQALGLEGSHSEERWVIDPAVNAGLRLLLRAK